MRDVDEPDRKQLLQVKQRLREEVLARRRGLTNGEQLSREICRRLTALPEYAAAQTVLYYVGVRSEVRTQELLDAAWASGKRVVVPYCENGQIEPLLAFGHEDLVPRTFGIPEPAPELRARSDHRVTPEELDLVVVPGLAFDRRGDRLGRGKGYYDKLLHRVRPDTTLIALAYECQLVEVIPRLDHDVPMHKVITERAMYERPASIVGG